MLRSFGILLDAHIRFEERELFPLIESTLSAGTLSEIEKKLKNYSPAVN
jgi:hemerythrin-like domain-containing protein